MHDRGLAVTGPLDKTGHRPISMAAHPIQLC